jgi:SAM-dependent methyltransferase
MQHVGEASDLSAFADGSYDVLLSSHTLEHCANALATLSEFTRVVRNDGLPVTIVPHEDGTFDHRRPTTPLAHFISDREAGVGEDDLTHLDEVLSLHDRARDPPTGDAAAFEARSRETMTNRGLHHHVFTTRSFAHLRDAAGLRIAAIEALLPFHVLAVLRKRAAPDNTALLSAAEFLRHSPFPSDRSDRDEEAA